MSDTQNFFGNEGVYKFSESQTALLKMASPIIDIVGDVNLEMMLYVRSAIIYLRSRGSPEVQVMISSPGGGVDSGLVIYDLLRLYPGKKIATVYDTAASMGALILQACDVRNCTRHSDVLIHHINRGRVTLDVLRSTAKAAKLREDMERDQARLYVILSSKTGKPVSAIRRECAKDKPMSAEEALKFGLIDAIV